MFLSHNQSRSLRSLFRDEYEGELFKPCNARELRVVVEPAELATVSGDSITWADVGTGVIRGKVVRNDGSVVDAAGEIVLVCGEPPAPVIKEPVLQRAVMVDPDA